MGKQITDKLVMIRPANFGFNAETAANNLFQSSDTQFTPVQIQSGAVGEFDRFVDKLRANGITVDVIDDTPEPVKPDAVFPNNWFSMHANGAVITYPMFAPVRRLERREDIFTELSNRYMIEKRYAFEQYEEEGQFLEGTGSMVIDRENSLVYACISPRTDIRVLDKFCVLFGMRMLAFHATFKGEEIYHTNVVMALGERFVVCCMDAVADPEERKSLQTAFENTGKTLVSITAEQMAAYAGNMLQVKNGKGDRFVVMSTQAYDSLTPTQKKTLGEHGVLIHSSLDTIEFFGGGSARCMMAENFLPEIPH